MSAKKKGLAQEKADVAVKQPPADPGRLMCLGGSKSDSWNNILANDAMKALWFGTSSEDDKSGS